MLGAHFLNFDGFTSLSDPISYQGYAVQISERFQQGVWAIGDIYPWHWYPVVLGALYAITAPVILIGKMLSVSLAALSSFFLLRLMRELDGNAKVSFWCALVATNAYPAFLLFGSTLVKEVFIVPLILVALLINIRMLKRNNPFLFFVFAIFLGLVVTLRFMVGEVLAVAFLLSWFIGASLPLSKRLAIGCIFSFLLGVEMLALGFSFFGGRLVEDIGTPEYIQEYRYKAYSQSDTVATGSTTNIDVFDESEAIHMVGLIYSFATVTLGPFPWQIQKVTHMVGIVESILWFCALIPITCALLRRSLWCAMLPIILFSGGWFVVVALGSDNIGATMRYRMPALLALCAFIPLGVEVLQHRYAILQERRIARRNKGF